MCTDAFRHFNVSVMDALRVPLKTIQERIGHALTGSFTPDVYGHTLDWESNEDAAKGLGEVIARAVAEADVKIDSGHLTAHQKKQENGAGPFTCTLLGTKRRVNELL
jgi:hypothetical protein